jgi:chromosomal replication initiation ATPase DnaA
LKEALPLGEAESRLRGTMLVQVTDTVARIGVPNLTALAWLERRLYGQIANAIKGIVGKDVDLQFIAAS